MDIYIPSSLQVIPIIFGTVAWILGCTFGGKGVLNHYPDVRYEGSPLSPRCYAAAEHLESEALLLVADPPHPRRHHNPYKPGDLLRKIRPFFKIWAIMRL